MIQALTLLIMSQAPALPVEPTEDQIPELVKLLTNAIESKNYMLMSGVLLMFVVMIFKKVIIPKLGDEEKYKPYIPAITFGITLVTGFATWTLNPKINLIETLITCVGVTVVASGSWETTFKPVMNLIAKILAENQKKNQSPSPVVIPDVSKIDTKVDPLKNATGDKKE
jgi:hypothetical protein